MTFRDYVELVLAYNGTVDNVHNMKQMDGRYTDTVDVAIDVTSEYKQSFLVTLYEEEMVFGIYCIESGNAIGSEDIPVEHLATILDLLTTGAKNG